jgi:hypothetical protein
MEQQEQASKKWKPDPAKHADDWRRIWFEILDSRRFAVRQIYGQEAADRYKPVKAEGEYFKTWGKLPDHVTDDDTEVPVHDAKRIVEMVDAHHARYFKDMKRMYQTNFDAYMMRLQRQAKEVQASPAYKATAKQREQLDEYNDAMLQKVRKLDADDKTQGTNTEGSQTKGADNTTAEKESR